MSGRRTSTLTLAVALLVGAAGGAAAQEPFQTPLNSGTTNGEGTVVRAGDGGVYQSGDYAFIIQARAITPACKDLSRVTTGGFGSYCASQFQVKQEDGPPKGVVPAPENAPSTRAPRGLQFGPSPRVTAERGQPKFRHVGSLVAGAIAEREQWVPHEDAAQKWGARLSIGWGGTTVFSAAAPLDDIAQVIQPVVPSLAQITTGGFGSYCACLLPPLDRELEPEDVLGAFGSWSEFLTRAATCGTGNLPRATKGGFGSYCAVLLPRSVVTGPQRVLLVHDAGGRVHLAPAEDVLVFSDPGIQAPPPPTNPYDHRQLFGCHLGLFGSQRDATPSEKTCDKAASVPAEVVPTFRPLPPAPPGVIRTVAAVEDAVMTPPTCPPCPLPKIAPNPLLGTWYRDVPAAGLQVVATFAPDELKLRATQTVDGHTVTVTATVHYTLTPDGLVFGVVTSADVSTKSGTKAGSPDADFAELALTVQGLADMPFSCRTKITSAGLMVSGLKYGLLMARRESEEFQVAFGGLFKSAKDGKVPPLAKLKPKADKARGEPILGAAIGALIGRPTGAALGNPPSLEPGERVGVDFSAAPPAKAPPAPPACPTPTDAASFGPPFLTKIKGLDPYSPQAVPAVPPPAPARQPGVSEDSTKQMALEAFGQLLQQSGVVCPTGGMVTGTGGVTVPSGRCEPCPQNTVPCDSVATQATVAPLAAPKTGPVGTWYRDIAGKQCVVKVTPDHLTLTVHDAQEVDGKVSTASLVITADYHLTRDGITALGLITSVDVNFEGDFPADDSKPFFEMLGDLQKSLEDKPLALTFRTYGDSLVIGNVRMPSASDRLDAQPAGYMAGRYKAAGDKLPKPKPTKMPAEPRAFVPNGPPPGLPVGGNPGSSLGQPLAAPGGFLPPPGSAYPATGPAFPPPLPSSNSDLLPPQQIPSAPPARVIPSSGEDSWVPPMAPPAKPGPVRPVIEGEESRTKGTFNPNTSGLLFRSESGDLHQIQNEWRRFWFDDRPSEPTPERIHGRIY
ncbi:hypothetical protein R5W23_002364 [Gemmata sp. JC673]|uniref:Uncharacterized protein n=1 Tax=Gemmata algarum TaxID=2975278 RepID=A0ABU5F314_9BACT|nr:hypothetical protein [Gemmata algarum]MDY3561105.1 hypothetical protein [Gemmata algarum]